MLTNIENIILYVCIGFAAALVLFLAIALIARAISLSRKQDVTVEATITDMNVTDMSIMKSVSLNADRNCNVIEFDTGNEKIKLQVSRWIYGTLDVGMKGTLTYKDNIFKSFVPYESEEQTEEPTEEPAE